MHFVGSHVSSLAIVKCDGLCGLMSLEFLIDSREALRGLMRHEFGNCGM